MTSLREYAGYHGGGSGFGGQLRAWNPPGESVDAALLPNFTRGNARADDLVRNNGYAANAIQLHQDHIVGSFFRLSHRPSWRYLGIGEEEARAFSREVEAAWKEFAEDDCCCIDVERKRTFTMMIREGVAMHAFNGELFVQATWDTRPSRLFRTQFRMVSPKRISNPNNTSDSRNCRAGVQINDSGAALGYYVSEDGYPGWMPQKWTWIPRELPGGRASFIHVFEPVEDGQTRGANVFYSVMEQMKMLDTLQNTQLQSAIVKAMYAATIESELDTQSAMDFILGANSQEQRERLTGWIGEIAAYYSAAPVRLGGAKVPHLMPGDSLNLQTAQDTDNGYPNTAIVGLQVDAEQFGGQQMTVNYHIRGRIIQVPSNYDPEKRTYSGIWDGSLKPAYSNNPAWCLWDMLTHPRYGMGKRLGAADVDKWALYAIGQYCDQTVPDGFGGTEPRMTFNAYLSQQRKAWDVLSD
ncbi:phage portal protein, partial [Escherichia coli]|nr:phage portal protein [Escherichia coli]MDN1882246.1 phage portal protein [Escherichia coli]